MLSVGESTDLTLCFLLLSRYRFGSVGFLGFFYEARGLVFTTFLVFLPISPRRASVVHADLEDQDFPFCSKFCLHMTSMPTIAECFFCLQSYQSTI